MAAKFVGQYTNVKTENLDPYMRALGKSNIIINKDKQSVIKTMQFDEGNLLSDKGSWHRRVSLYLYFYRGSHEQPHHKTPSI